MVAIAAAVAVGSVQDHLRSAQAKATR